jgi:hypothetical protein
MKCRRCGNDFEFNNEHRKVLAMSAVCRVYNPNQLCKECRPYSERG